MNRRVVFQIIFVVLFVFFAFLTYYFIRLGITGMLVDAYAFLEARFRITEKMPGFWKRRMYWEKVAIVLGIIHLVLYILFLQTYEAFGKAGEGQLGFMLFELPLFIIGFFDQWMSKLGYYSIIIWGTMAYAAIGAFFGMIIDGLIYCFNYYGNKGGDEC